MKLKLCLLLILSLFVLQACGGSDGATSGSISIIPTISSTGTIATNGVHVASIAVTYTQPSGKVPNGTTIDITIRDSSGVSVYTNSATLYSENTKIFSFGVYQTASVQTYSISVLVNNEMSAGKLLVFPAGT